jgi:hypothetical protein
MDTDLISLRVRIRECMGCSFREQTISPLAPAVVETPVKIMFIGENPSWAEKLAT